MQALNVVWDSRGLRARLVPSAGGAGWQRRAPSPSASASLQGPGAEIKLICSDVDGTLLNSQQQLTPRVQQAVQQAAAVGVPLVVATGKARGPWAADVLPRLGGAMPGVYLQGLLIYGADGRPLFSRVLDDAVVLECIELATSLGVTLTAYSDERILCAATDEHTDRLLFYREPTPEAVGRMQHIVGAEPVQKMIFMAPQPRIDEIRPLVEQRLLGQASLTTALSGMLEVLPRGASKGAGVAWLLDHLGIRAQDVLALGDGENDVEMLQLVGVGVAMGNAGTRVKAAAQFTTATNDDCGVADAIERFVLQPRRTFV